MYNTNRPSDEELPSTRQLVRSTTLAALAAVAILVAVVLPAEYGMDPTGVGDALGLKRMGEIKMSLAREAAAQRETESATSQPSASAVEETVTAPVSPPAENATAPSPEPVPEPAEPEPTLMSHEMQVTLAPDEGTEIKVTMMKGAKVQYTWWTDGGRANFDVHGNSKELKIKYHNYSKGSEQKSQGTLEAAFDGGHGWFWRNRTAKTITVTLQTNGEYTDIKHLK